MTDIFSYDDTKKMLNTLRKLNSSSVKQIREQFDPQQSQQPMVDNDENSGTEKQDFTVINTVDVVLNSTDSQDLVLSDEEKGKISQLIDDFRTEVSELCDFGKLNFYNDSAKLDVRINDLNLNLTLSAGDDNGIYLSSPSMIKLSEEVFDILNKLKTYEIKFTSVINEIISARKQN